MEYIYLKPEVNCAEVSSIYKDVNFNTLPLYCVGRYNCNLTRVLMQFDLSNISKNFKIVEAKLKLKLNNNIMCGNFINAYKITEPWDYKTVTWNSKVGFNSHKTIFTIKDSGKLIYEFNLTNLVEKWNENVALNNGLILISNENCVGKTLIDGNSICLEIKCSIDNGCKCDRFYEEFQYVTSKEKNFFTKLINTSNFRIITYFVKNIGKEEVRVTTQIGPNNIEFINENNDCVIKPNEIRTFTPYMFSKFIRLSCQSDNDMEKKLEVWFQSQIQ